MQLYASRPSPIKRGMKSHRGCWCWRGEGQDHEEFGGFFGWAQGWERFEAEAGIVIRVARKDDARGGFSGKRRDAVADECRADALALVLRCHRYRA